MSRFSISGVWSRNGWAYRKASWTAGFCLAAGAACLLAQSGPGAYRAAYQAWREGDPKLEMDAGTAGAALAPRTTKAAGLSAAYASAHTAALHDLADQQQQNLTWLRANTARPLPELYSPPDAVRFVDRETGNIGATMSTFANDPDPGIAELRKALLKEQNALRALRSSVLDRQTAEDKAIRAGSNSEIARAKALEEYTFLSLPLNEASEAMTQEGNLWAAYYPQLADGARDASTVLPPAGNLPTPVPVTNGGQAPEPATQKPSITLLPLSRYIGSWGYVAGNPSFGAQPVSITFNVSEDNGVATGSFVGRFKLPQGSTGDPTLNFKFSGKLQPNRIQSFPLTTSDGMTGTVQLIPGRAFNELELNFNIEATDGKVHQGDMVLLKQ